MNISGQGHLFNSFCYNHLRFKSSNDLVNEYLYGTRAMNHFPIFYVYCLFYVENKTISYHYILNHGKSNSNINI